MSSLYIINIFFKHKSYVWLLIVLLLLVNIHQVTTFATWYLECKHVSGLEFIQNKFSMDFDFFDVNLFKTLSNENDNILFSPLTISLAVSMLLLGSDETTK